MSAGPAGEGGCESRRHPGVALVVFLLVQVFEFEALLDGLERRGRAPKAEVVMGDPAVSSVSRQIPPLDGDS